MNSEPLNASGKASEKLICHEILRRLFPKRFPLSQGLGKYRRGLCLSTKEGKGATVRKRYTRPGLDTLGKLSHQMLFASIPGNFYFKVTRWCTASVGVWCFLKVCHVDPRVSLEFGGTSVGLQFLMRLKSLSGGVFPNR